MDMSGNTATPAIMLAAGALFAGVASVLAAEPPATLAQAAFDTPGGTLDLLGDATATDGKVFDRDDLRFKQERTAIGIVPGLSARTEATMVKGFPSLRPSASILRHHLVVGEARVSSPLVCTEEMIEYGGPGQHNPYFCWHRPPVRGSAASCTAARG
jgi:hypothetical protein